MATEMIRSKTIENSTPHTTVYNVADTTKQIDIYLDRADLVDFSVALAVQLFLSLDNRLSWRPWGGFGTVGGAVQNAETKATETRSGMTVNIPDGKGRKIMATLTIIGSAKTSLAFEER